MPTSRDLFDEFRERSFNEAISSRENYYDMLVDQVRYAISRDSEAERDEMMRSLYMDLTNQAARSALVYNGIMSWSDDMSETYYGRPFASALSTSARVEDLLKEIVRESGADYVCKDKMGISNEEYLDYIGRLATSVTMKDVQDEFFKQSTLDSRENSMSKYASELLDGNKEIRYSGNLNNNYDRQISEVYALYNNAWDNIKKAGFFGNLFNLGAFFRNVGLIRKANAIFDKVGFSTKNDGPDVAEAFTTTADQCAGKDLAYLAELRSSFAEDAKLAQFKDVKEVRTARDKLESTIAAIRSGAMEHPMHKVNAILGKYGLSVTEDKTYRPGLVEGISAFNEELVAQEYDKTGQTKPFNDYIKGIFYKSFTQMTAAAIKSGNGLNISEIMKDASDITVAMAKDYTPIYEAPDFKNIAENSAFGSYDAAKITDYVKNILNNNGASESYDLEALKNEIEQTFREYKNPIIEDYKAKEAEAIEQPEVAVESEEAAAAETDEVRINISVDLTGGQPVKEELQPRVDERPLEKSQSMTMQ